jgi:hypothetical protein
LEKEELLADAGFALVITGLLAATFMFPYVDNCGDSPYYESNRSECDLYTIIFFAGIVVGILGFVFVAVGIIAARRSKRSPPGKQ